MRCPVTQHRQLREIGFLTKQRICADYFRRGLANCSGAAEATVTPS